MMKRTFPLIALALIALSIYLFVSAPPPLQTAAVESGVMIPIEQVLRTVSAENDLARALWTQEIVGAGQVAGLAFDEDWRESTVEAGPLPALFLRESAANLETYPVPLSLFLGSDFPINPSNQFSGAQTDRFEQIKATGEPQFFYADDTQLHTAMFPDYASVQPCIVCHNEHPDTPKADWELNDVMGATTWAYPKAEVSLTEYMEIISAVRRSFAETYTTYLEKTATFTNPPPIGDQWPSEGYYLPSAEIFMQEFTRRASSQTLNDLLTMGIEP